MLAAFAGGCASMPIAPPEPLVTFEDKVAWIVRLEDQRVLRDPSPEALPRSVTPESIPAVTPTPPPMPDLGRLVHDSEARIRRRAALAIGRVGLPEGIAPLAELLADPEPEVRQMAAFALGLIGDRDALEHLLLALSDPSPLVRGSAAEAVGLIGDSTTADAVAEMARRIVDSGSLVRIPPDEDDPRRDTAAAAYRLALYSLVRLGSYPALAAAALDESGQPLLRWWPVASALQRAADDRALPALRSLASDPHPYTRAFAVRALGELKDSQSVAMLLPLVVGNDRAVAIQAVRALGLIGDQKAAPALLRLIRDPETDSHRRHEAVLALGLIGGEGVVDTMIDLLASPSPEIRAAAVRSLARFDPEGFVVILSGLDPDAHWSVRASLAATLGTLSPEAALPRLRAMLQDADQRVIPAVLAALTSLRAPDGPGILVEHLTMDDPGVRAAAAAGLGELRPPGGGELLVEAYRFAQRDPTHVARVAALKALAEYGGGEVTALLHEALADPNWAVRLQAASLLNARDATSDASHAIRPAPTHLTASVYEADRVVNPQVSTQVYAETDRGIIQIELAVLDAPLTVENFIALAQQGFYDGVSVHRVVPDYAIQSGDPRGDGEGGPGFTIRGEINQRPFLRGVVGMALDGADTGGSQFFITHSPQPHLDGRYTAFGRVVSGMEVVDQLEQWDVIRRVRIWDGETFVQD